MATSSTEAEYMATANAMKEVIWIQQLLKELRRSIKGDGLYSDNQGTIVLAQNPQFYARTKHIDVQYHFITEYIKNRIITLEYCPTKDTVADALTKVLPKGKALDPDEGNGLGVIATVHK